MTIRPAVAAACLVAAGLAAAPAATSAATPAGAAGDFRLTSATLQPGDTMPAANVFNGFGCTGGNRSPALSWQGVPAGTKSLVLTLYDPDAPTGSGWWHWVVYDIPPTAHALAADAGKPGGRALPAGAVEAKNDFGYAGYGGACPPPGSAHRYIFTLYALKVTNLDVPADAGPALVGFVTRANLIASATLQVTYGR